MTVFCANTQSPEALRFHGTTALCERLKARAYLCFSLLNVGVGEVATMCGARYLFYRSRRTSCGKDRPSSNDQEMQTNSKYLPNIAILTNEMREKRLKRTIACRPWVLHGVRLDLLVVLNLHDSSKPSLLHPSLRSRWLFFFLRCVSYTTSFLAMTSHKVLSCGAAAHM